MAREIHSTVIDGHRYEMTQLGATPGYQLFTRISKVVIPSIGILVDAVKSTDGIGGINLSDKSAIHGLQTLTANMKQEDLDHVIVELRNVCHVGVNGSDKTVPLANIFEAHFSGDIGGLFRWLFWGLKVQFGNFSNAFGGLKGLGVEDASPEANSPSR